MTLPTDTVPFTGTTLIGFVLDRSGSMGTIYQETLEGANEYISGLQKQDGADVFLTWTLFDDSVQTIRDNVPIKEVQPITNKEYVLGGMTALNDAIGHSITSMEKRAAVLRLNGTVVRVLVVIYTDGGENASREYTNIADIIKKKNAEGSWSFLFLGADIDAFSVARQYNINQGAVVAFSKMSTKGIMGASAAASNAYRGSSAMCSTSLAFDNEPVYSTAGGFVQQGTFNEATGATVDPASAWKTQLGIGSPLGAKTVLKATQTTTTTDADLLQQATTADLSV